jgi:hypothetical protein
VKRLLYKVGELWRLYKRGDGDLLDGRFVEAKPFLGLLFLELRGLRNRIGDA